MTARVLSGRSNQLSYNCAEKGRIFAYTSILWRLFVPHKKACMCSSIRRSLDLPARKSAYTALGCM